METLFDADISVHYGFIHLLGAGDDAEVFRDAFAGQTNGLVGAAVPGELTMATGLHTGRVPVIVQWYDSEPPVGDDWPDVVEVSYRPNSTDLILATFQDAYRVHLPAARDLRVRFCAKGMDAANDADTVLGNEPTIDSYLLQLWPAHHAPDLILRTTSRLATHRHEQARNHPFGDDHDDHLGDHITTENIEQDGGAVVRNDAIRRVREE